jgi:hypothetical protein
MDLLAKIADDQYREVDEALRGMDVGELEKVWKDAGYLKERARFMLSTRFGVRVR